MEIFYWKYLRFTWTRRPLIFTHTFVSPISTHLYNTISTRSPEPQAPLLLSLAGEGDHEVFHVSAIRSQRAQHSGQKSASTFYWWKSRYGRYFMTKNKNIFGCRQRQHDRVDRAEYPATFWEAQSGGARRGQPDRAGRLAQETRVVWS